MSGKIVNLNRVRKQRQRSQAAQMADENAIKFGRTKAQKQLEKASADKSERDLDNHEREE